MFEVCRHRTGTCIFAASSTYDPYTGKYSDLPYTYCGQAAGADTRVLKFNKCWDNMTNGERKRHAKKTNDEVMHSLGYTYNKSKKKWKKIK